MFAVVLGCLWVIWFLVWVGVVVFCLVLRGWWCVSVLLWFEVWCGVGIIVSELRLVSGLGRVLGLRGFPGF